MELLELPELELTLDTRAPAYIGKRRVAEKWGNAVRLIRARVTVLERRKV